MHIVVTFFVWIKRGWILTFFLLPWRILPRKIMLTLNCSPFPVLSTERLTLRRPLLTDDKETFAMRSDEDVNRYIDRQKPASMADAQEVLQRLTGYIDRNESIAWAINLKGDATLLGTICLWNLDHENGVAEIGYELNPAFQGKGIMSEAMVAVLDYGFSVMQAGTIKGWVHKDNGASLKLLEKYGFNRDMVEEEKHRGDAHFNNMVIYTLARGI